MQQKQRGSRTWRELLSSLDAQEKQRIISALGIQEKTWERWISGQTELPRMSKIQQLFTVLPAKTRRLFIESVQQDPDFSRYAADIPLLTPRTTIPSMFYSRVIEANVVAPESLRFTTICQLVLLQMVGQLDAYNLGIYAGILTCTPPSYGNKVRTLSQRLALGTPPWNTVIEQKSFFLGAESIVGQAAIAYTPLIIQDIRNSGDSDSVDLDPHTMSTAALPIQRDRRIAGVLVVGSTQPNFFSPSSLKIIQQYCHLLVISLNDSEFYERQQFQLEWVPSISKQQVYFVQFRERVSLVIKQAQQNGNAKSWLEVEQEVRQQIETELLEGRDTLCQHPPQTKTHTSY